MGIMQVIHNAGSKQAFFDWLSTRDTKKCSPSVVVSCIDIISEYAIYKEICHTDFWYITHPSDFEHIYTKILDALPLSSLDRSMYKTFIVMGQLYLEFLREKPFSNVVADADSEGMYKSVTPSGESTDQQEFFQEEKQLKKQASREINPEGLIAWLITQPNANGTLYLERVVRQYIWALRYAPAKLILTTVDNRNVFSCQTVKELNSLWGVFKSAPNYQNVNRGTSGQFSAGLSCLSRYLEYLSGCQENKPTHVQASKLLPTAVQAIQNKPPVRSAILVDFDRPGRCAQTQPVSCVINGQAVIPNKPYWSQLLVTITERFITEGNPRLAELEKVAVYGSRAFFLPQKPAIGTCALLSNGKWISTNYPPQIIVVIIRNLCRHCGLGLEDISISYIPKNSPTEWSEKRLILGNKNTSDLVTANSVFEPGVLKAVSNVLVAHFPNGFRVDSPIELMRFRSYSADDSSNGIPAIDEDLKKAIGLCGTLFEGKVYVVGKETESRLKGEIDAEVVSGAKIIYYSNFYARHESWLFAGSVVSEVMLKEVLKKFYPAYTYKASYFSTNRNNGTELSIINGEIMRVWNGDTLLSYEQISRRLPYIPLDKIKLVFAQNGDFIWNSKEVYTHIGMVDISDEERTDIEEYVAAACRTAGYASISDVPLREIEEHNNELTITAIHNAVFAIVLADKYEKRGKIITRKGDTLDALSIMKEHCRSVDRSTLQQLLDTERELTGEMNIWTLLDAGYAIMVRSDEDTFVAEKLVHFDVFEIDKAIDQFMAGEYLPLLSVSTFAAFPECRTGWNLYLLQSYCRRFSERYRFEVLSLNNSNAGVIVRKSCTLSYLEIMADAVASSNTVLEKAAIEDFLCNAGYLGRRRYSKTDELIRLAKNIRERRN
jgi:hypothetical protein